MKGFSEGLHLITYSQWIQSILILLAALSHWKYNLHSSPTSNAPHRDPASHHLFCWRLSLQSPLFSSSPFWHSYILFYLFISLFLPTPGGFGDLSFLTRVWTPAVEVWSLNRWTVRKFPRCSFLEVRLIIFFAAKDGRALYSQQKQDQELTEAQIMNSLQNSDLNWRK